MRSRCNLSNSLTRMRARFARCSLLSLSYNIIAFSIVRNRFVPCAAPWCVAPPDAVSAGTPPFSSRNPQAVFENPLVVGASLAGCVRGLLATSWVRNQQVKWLSINLHPLRKDSVDHVFRDRNLEGISVVSSFQLDIVRVRSVEWFLLLARRHGVRKLIFLHSEPVVGETESISPGVDLKILLSRCCHVGWSEGGWNCRIWGNLNMAIVKKLSCS